LPDILFVANINKTKSIQLPLINLLACQILLAISADQVPTVGLKTEQLAPIGMGGWYTDLW